MILEADGYGNITKWAEIAYPRRTVDQDMPEKGRLWVKYNEASFKNVDDSDDFYRIGVPYQNMAYEIYGLVFSNNVKFDASILSDIDSAAELHFEDVYSGTGIKKRMFAHSKQYFYNEDCDDILANLGEIASHALPYQSKTLAYTDGLLDLLKEKNEIDTNQFHNDLLEAANLATILSASNAGFDSGSGNYWQLSGRQTFDTNNYFLPLTNIDPFGNETEIDYDSYKLLPNKISDPLANETLIWNDYRVLQPCKIKDINLNYTSVDFDELGLVTATAIMGKETSSNVFQGDTIDDPTISMEYDLHNWKNNGKPVYVHVSARETHKDSNTNWLESYTYSNGLGQEIQTKVQAEDGLAWQLDTNGDPEEVNSTDRWTATGRIILNNKGKVVKQYEPWFSTTFEYEDEDELTEYGVTPVMHYDPLGRPVKTDLPDGTLTRVEFTAWKQENWDQNDTVLDEDANGYICAWYIDRNEPDPSGAEPTDPDERAAWIAANHAGTPQIQHFDGLGRLFLVVDDNKTASYETRYGFDINGLPILVTDAKDREMTHTIFNALGEAVYTENIDSGRRWSLTDVAGKPIYRWDNRHFQFRHTYDSLQRPLNRYVKEDATETLVEKTEYGTVSNTNTNRNGKLFRQYDQSGFNTIFEYDFKGNPVYLRKRFCEVYDQTIDWDGSPTLLSDIFNTELTYDAMNRPTEILQPDDSVVAYAYNKAGLLENVQAKIRGITTYTEFVTNIDYNEKGQRTDIYYRNGSKTAYTYDDKSFRLTRLLTTRNTGQDTLQDINYTYDAVGNITEVEDDAQQTFYYSNSVIAPKGKYWYDALYRLTKATGRELASLAMPTDADFVNNLAVPNTASNAMQNYTQEYRYDELGNIEQMRSVGDWTRDYYYETANNRLKNHDGGNDVYSYDEHGNCTEMPHLPELDWDYKDELKEVTLNASNHKAYYTYDASGERVRKVVDKGSVVEERLYIGGFEVYRKTVSGTLNYVRETLKITEGRNTIAQLETKTIENGNTISTPTTIQRFQYSNHLGSACLELDSNAAIISYEEYHPFGTTSYRSGSSETEVSLKRYKYVGKERDEETGLYYYGARYYAAWIARFVSVDPLQFEYAHLNPYNYAANKPINSIDLDGLQTPDEPVTNNKPYKFDKTETSISFENNTKTPQEQLEYDVNVESGKYYGFVHGLNPISQVEDFLGLLDAIGTYFKDIDQPGFLWTQDSSGQNYLIEVSLLQNQEENKTNADQGYSKGFEEGKMVGQLTFDVATGFMGELLTSKNVFKIFKVDEMNVVADMVEDATDVAKFVDKAEAAETGTTAIAKYDANFAVSQGLENGGFNFNNIRSMIPEGTPNTFKPAYGDEKYLFKINDTKIQLKWHTPEFAGNAPFGSNASLFNTAQIKVGNKYLMQFGGFSRNGYSNFIHIPLK